MFVVLLIFLILKLLYVLILYFYNSRYLEYMIVRVTILNTLTNYIVKRDSINYTLVLLIVCICLLEKMVLFL